MSVSPVAADQVYYVGVSGGENAVGNVGPSGIFQEERFIVTGIPEDTIREFHAKAVPDRRQRALLLAVPGA